MSNGIELHLSKKAIRKLFGRKRISVSKNIDKMLEKFSEKVNEDVLAEFLRERR